MKRTEIAGWDDPDQCALAFMYDTDLMPFERTLRRGEEFTTACVFAGGFQNGDGFNDPHWVLPSYTAQVLERRVDARARRGSTTRGSPLSAVSITICACSLIDAAGAMGMDIFTIDDGWQQEYGENEVNLTAFPGGLKPILDAVEGKGMRLGLVDSHGGDWQHRRRTIASILSGRRSTARQGQETGTTAGEKAVMCMATAYRDAAAERIIDAIERFHLAYVKLDLTTIFNAYGEAPGCWAKGHDHGNWAESLNLIYEGIS